VCITERIQTAKENPNDPDVPLDSVVTTGDLREMQRLSREMKEKAAKVFENDGNEKKGIAVQENAPAPKL